MNDRVPARPATLQDVAREAGVSTITASRALGNPGLVTPATIERVRRAVAATGYIPNWMAGGLRGKRSRLVALLVPSISVAQFLPTVEALTDTLGGAGYQLILGQAGYDHAREEALIDTMIGRRPDAIVTTGLVRSASARARLRQAGMPVVETWDLGDRPIDLQVGFSHAGVGAAVASFFRGRGWQPVGLATGDDHRGSLRRRGFVEAIGREVPTAVVPAPSSLALGRQALGELLAAEPRLRAVACSSDLLAHGVLVEALARGLRVPEDLAVCGFGDADFAAHTVPALTTVRVDGAAIGATAARLILARCTGEPIAAPVVDVGFRIVERASTGIAA